MSRERTVVSRQRYTSGRVFGPNGYWYTNTAGMLGGTAGIAGPSDRDAINLFSLHVGEHHTVEDSVLRVRNRVQALRDTPEKAERMRWVLQFSLFDASMGNACTPPHERGYDLEAIEGQTRSDEPYSGAEDAVGYAGGGDFDADPAFGRAIREVFRLAALQLGEGCGPGDVAHDTAPSPGAGAGEADKEGAEAQATVTRRLPNMARRLTQWVRTRL